MTRTFDLRQGVESGLSESIAARLAAGEVGIVPTETVLGLVAAVSRPEACQRIFDIKGRDQAKLLPWMTAHPQTALSQVHKSRVAAKLARVLWPGPLTMVLGDGAGQAWRVPDHKFLHDVLLECKGPIVATSANRSGAPAPVAAESIDPELLAAVDFAVLDHPTRTATPSTVVRVNQRDGVEILRPGAILESRVVLLAQYRIEVICSGNTCRSPLAAAMLRRELQDEPSVAISSCGTSCDSGSPVSQGSLHAAAARGLDLRGHLSRGLPEDLAEADLVLCMTDHHRDRVLQHCAPHGAPQRTELLSTSNQAIADPWGGDDEDYECLANNLEPHVKAWGAFVRNHLAETRAGE
jgi:tRNA threonylcarbamoyl adenosine modification protein (Sua5/YciO/YrdC/YwlC family)